jgi:chromosome segregation ATPase
LTRLRAERAEFQEDRAQAEQYHRELEQNQHEISALRAEFEQRVLAKDAELQAIQSGADAMRGQFDASINELQLQLAQKQLLVESRVTETENLKGQVDRLSEQLAQRDSASAGLQTQFQNATEAAHAEHQAALAALRDEYQIRQRNLDTELAQEKQRVGALMHQMADLEQQKNAFETQTKERQLEREALIVEAAAVRSRLDELETRRQTELAAAEQAQNQVRSDLESELAAARSELQQRAWASAQHQAMLENLALAHKDQIQKLEVKIAEQQNSINHDHLQLEKSHAQTRLLEQHIEELTAELRQAEITAVNRAVHIKEEYGIRIAELERQIAQKTVELQERGASTSDMEQTLRRELDRLIREAQEKNQILQDRNDELVRVKAEMDTIQEQFRNMESTTSQAEASSSAEIEKMRTEFQAQLALLQAELSQKEWALEEQRAATGTIEAQLRQNLESLKQQLAETEARVKEDKDKFVMGENQRTVEQQERYKNFRETLDAVVNGDDGSFPASENRRRWRAGFAWKRRWKS